MAALHGDSSSSFSSFSSKTRCAYDVFLSFRGEDTRIDFVDHLYAALLRNGINTFKDVALKPGEEISSTLFKAIEESEMSIIILSKHYASSRWCLEELTKILDCRRTTGQQVLPVFYDVDPWEVQHQTNSVGEAFVKLRKWLRDDEMKVQEWKKALTEVASFSGMHLGNRNEPEFIRTILQWVNSILVKRTSFQIAPYTIGIESCVKDVISLLDIEKNDSTCVVGIFGTGGIGKTTLAKAVYNKIAFQFEGSCFLENVRETFNQKDGLISIQNKLLSRTLGYSSLTVDSVDQGITLIKQRLNHLRVLVVLDDVDQLIQLEKIVGKGNWFGSGSRIVITTRDKKLLTEHQVLPYEVKELDHDKALQLFSLHAFMRDCPDYGYEEVTEDAVHYCGGLPLALEVLGSSLQGRDILYWKMKLDKYKRIPHYDIQKILRISFDGLDENAKNIFLDIACFFQGEKEKHVLEILDGCGFQSYDGIEELKNKCLITEFSGLLVMNNLLQEMGREIVRQESPKEPGKRSRLWFYEDIRHVLDENTGTNKVEGIWINLPEQDLMHLSSEALKKMTSLRLFISHNTRFSVEPDFISNELRLLDWQLHTVMFRNLLS